MRKRLLPLIAALCAVCLGSRPAKAADETQGTPAGSEKVITNQVTLEGTVEDVNKETREITLKGPDGNTESFKVDAAVQRFDQVEKGDKVQVDYLESVALSLGKEGEEAPGVPESVVVAPLEGDKPSGVAAETRKLTATVESIDGEEVTLRGPADNVVTLKVPAEAARKLKVGDQVNAQYTQTVAVDVRKP